MKMWVAIILAICLSVSASAQQSPSILLFRNVDVFDGSRMIRHTSVLVRDGMIRAVGPEDTTAAQSAQVIDGKGKTLLPGLMDAHMHLGQFQVERFLKDALEFGVTTELEMWGSTPTLELRKKLQASEDPNLADFRTAGIGVTVPDGHPTQMMDKPTPFATLTPGADVQAFVDARIAEGSEYIKIIDEHLLPTVTKQQIEEVVTAAHRRNKLVIAHINTQAEARDCIDAGVDGLAHIPSDSPLAPDFARFAAEHHVFVLTTLTVFDSMAAATAKSSWWQEAPNLASHLTPSMQTILKLKMPPGFDKKERILYAEAAVRALHRAGVPLLAGTDAPAPGVPHGLGLHRELELLVQSGLKPTEALAAATSEPARFFGFHDRGRIAKGFRADLVLIQGDPSVDITTTRNIVGVWKLGIPYSRYSANAALSKPGSSPM
ncbi:MAG TPA: amidohydrolase family protein [Chthonomonadaceae bacterium]|nr:amidohydrolase family protein [Chthonomonadaceae bacterium]